MSLFPKGKEKAETDIRYAVCWGVLLTALSFVALVSLFDTALKQMSGYLEASIALGIFLFLAAMTFGIYRKSRACALVLTIVFFARILGSALTIVEEFGNPFFEIAFDFLGAFYCYKGIRGTFAYHKLMQGTPSVTKN